jgi:GGDEF domain-containing protein
VHDNLTGLPNRELFLNRLDTVISIAIRRQNMRPSVFVIDIDRFKQVNDGLGISAGDTILADHRAPPAPADEAAGHAVALRGRPVRADAPVGAGSGPHRGVADAVRAAISTPINFAKREIVLTASIGLASWNAQQASAEDMVKDAELAMHQAKRYGGDRAEPFRPAFRSAGTSRLQIESDLRRALEREI